MKKFRRKKSDSEDAFNLSLVSARGHRHSYVPQNSFGGCTTPLAASSLTVTTTSMPSRILTAPPSYRHSYTSRSTLGGSQALTPVGSYISAISEDSVRVSPPTVGQLTAAAMSRVELVRLELPSLGSEFKGRAEFVDEVIELLDEMQQVRQQK